MGVSAPSSDAHARASASKGHKPSQVKATTDASFSIKPVQSRVLKGVTMIVPQVGEAARALADAQIKPQLTLVPDTPVQIAHGVPPRIAAYAAAHALPSPCLILDVDIVEQAFHGLSAALPDAHIYYAVKANPAPEVLARLQALGSNFDVASRREIEMCLAQGTSSNRISFGNTIKKESDIAFAHAVGVDLFAFDSEAELEKLARSAPGAKVYARILMECEGADWPLSRKFGCAPAMAADLLIRARDMGLVPWGVSFHVGSQQTNPAAFDYAVSVAAGVFARVHEAGIRLGLLNVGGGFPSRYQHDVPTHTAYGDAIRNAVTRHIEARGFGRPDVIVEPGRGMVGDAGVIQAEVVLISRKDDTDPRRWVYLDIGKFSGLAETMEEAIKYRFVTPHDGGPTGPVVLAGPTCDSADILYEKADYCLPLDLAVGDKVFILTTGAYTTTYSSVCFNGFDPLASVCI